MPSILTKLYAKETVTAPNSKITALDCFFGAKFIQPKAQAE